MNDDDDADAYSDYGMLMLMTHAAVMIICVKNQ